MYSYGIDTPDWEEIRHGMDRKEFFNLAQSYSFDIQQMLSDIDQGLKQHSTNMEAINEFVDDMNLIKPIMRKWYNTFRKNHDVE